MLKFKLKKKNKLKNKQVILQVEKLQIKANHNKIILKTIKMNQYKILVLVNY
jgi:hypothetical protein